jgi:hypothetical protein
MTFFHFSYWAGEGRALVRLVPRGVMILATPFQLGVLQHLVDLTAGQRARQRTPADACMRSTNRRRTGQGFRSNRQVGINRAAHRSVVAIAGRLSLVNGTAPAMLGRELHLPAR